MVRHKTLKRFTPKNNNSKAVHSEQSNRWKIHMDSLECKSKFCQCWKDDNNKDNILTNTEKITTKLPTNKAKFNNSSPNVIALLSRNNSCMVLKQLLNSGWDINERSVIDGATALTEAIVRRRVDLIKCLIANGADISVRDDYGTNALMKAIVVKDTNIFNMIWQHGKEGRNLLETDNQGKTLLHLAVEVQWEKCVLLLINNGASVNSSDNEGKTPLMIAASQGHNRIVEQLILAGSNILAADKYEETSICHAYQSLMWCTAQQMLNKLSANECKQYVKNLLDKIRTPKEGSEPEKIEYYSWILLGLIATAQLVDKESYIMKVYYKLKVIANVLSCLQRLLNKCETVTFISLLCVNCCLTFDFVNCQLEVNGGFVLQFLHAGGPEFFLKAATFHHKDGNKNYFCSTACLLPILLLSEVNSGKEWLRNNVMRLLPLVQSFQECCLENCFLMFTIKLSGKGSQSIHKKIWTHFIEYFNTIAYEKQQETIAQLLCDEIRMNKKKGKKGVKKQLKRKHQPQRQMYGDSLFDSKNDTQVNNTEKSSLESDFKDVEQGSNNSNRGKTRVDNRCEQSLLSPTEMSQKTCKKMLLMNSASKASSDIDSSLNRSNLDNIHEKSVENVNTIAKCYNEMELNANVNKDCYNIDEDLGDQWTKVVAKKLTCKYENRSKNRVKGEMKILDKTENNNNPRKSSNNSSIKQSISEGPIKKDNIIIEHNFKGQYSKTTTVTEGTVKKDNILEPNSKAQYLKTTCITEGIVKVDNSLGLTINTDLNQGPVKKDNHLEPNFKDKHSKPHSITETPAKVDSSLGSNFNTQHRKNSTSYPIGQVDLNKGKFLIAQVPTPPEYQEKYKAKPVSGRRNSNDYTPSSYPYLSKKSKPSLASKQNANYTRNSVLDSQHKKGKISLEELLIAKIESYCMSEDNSVDSNCKSHNIQSKTSSEKTQMIKPNRESNGGLPFFMPSIHFESEKDWKKPLESEYNVQKPRKADLIKAVNNDQVKLIEIPLTKPVVPNKQAYMIEKHILPMHDTTNVNIIPKVNTISEDNIIPRVYVRSDADITADVNLTSDVNMRPDVNNIPGVNIRPDVNIIPNINIRPDINVKPNVKINQDLNVTDETMIKNDVNIKPIAHIPSGMEFKGGIEVTNVTPFGGVTQEVDLLSDDTAAVIDRVSYLDVSQDLDVTPDLDVTQELDIAFGLDVTPERNIAPGLAITPGMLSVPNYAALQTTAKQVNGSCNIDLLNTKPESKEMLTTGNYLQTEESYLNNKESFRIRPKKEDFTNNSFLKERAEPINFHFFQELHKKVEENQEKYVKGLENNGTTMEKSFSFENCSIFLPNEKENYLKKRYHMARFSKDPVCLNFSSNSSPAFRDMQLAWMRQYLQQLCQKSITRDSVYNHNAFYYMTYFSQKEKDSLMTDFPEIFSSNVSTGYHISYQLTKTPMKEKENNCLKANFNISTFVKPELEVLSGIKKPFGPFEKHQKSIRWQKHINHLLQLSPRNLCHVEDVVLPLYIRNYNINVRGNHFVVVGLLSDGTELAVKLYRANECPVVCGALRKLSQACLDSRFVVNYKTVMVGQKFFLVTMNLCECNLKEYIDWKKYSNRFDHSTASYLFWHMMSSLKYLHDNNIVHGRLEPKNILITVYGRLLLSNYGFHSSWIHGPECHNCNYFMSDNQKCWQSSDFLRSGDGHKFSIKSDIQVAGMVAYFILSGGYHPFGKSSSEIPLNIILHEKQVYNLSLEASDIITMMLSAVPNERPTASEVLKHPYFWSNKWKLQFLLTVGSDILNAMMLQRKGNSEINIINCLSICDTIGYFKNWMLQIDKIILDELQKIRPIGNSMIELVIFLYNSCILYKQMCQEVKDILNEPFNYFLRKFPKLFQVIYHVIGKSSHRHRNIYKTFY